jgi:hypothetical protein
LIATVCLGVLPLNTSSTAAAAAASVGCDSFSAGYRYGMVWYGMVGSAPAKSYVLKKIESLCCSTNMSIELVMLSYLDPFSAVI